MTTIFFGGDVMTGRGIDQIMPHSCDPVIYESCVRDARSYILLAERVNGDIPRAVDFDYVWGDARQVLRQLKPDIRIINLETAVTDRGEPWPGKGIHYHMHPKNVALLAKAEIDCCTLANNHVLDWHYDGLYDTLATLKGAGIAIAGAGLNIDEAERPAVLADRSARNGTGGAGAARVKVFSFCLPSSGVPDSWLACQARPGVNLLPDLSGETFHYVKTLIDSSSKPGDVVVFSVHWGGNWGYIIPDSHRSFAHRLIDEAGVDIVYGHSSHHVVGIERYHDKLIMYGCGDLINDYEGISGYASYRGHLSLMYLVTMESPAGRMAGLTVVPMQMKQFRLRHASADDVEWLCLTLNREGQNLNSRFVVNSDNTLTLCSP